MTLQGFIDKLYKAGWSSPCDAQHIKIKEIWEELRQTGISVHEAEVKLLEDILHDCRDRADLDTCGDLAKRIDAALIHRKDLAAIRPQRSSHDH